MKRLLLLLIPVLAVVTTACDPVTPYAAIVDGHVISAQEITNELRVATDNPRFSQVLNQELSSGASGTSSGGLQPQGKNTVNVDYTANILFNRIVVELINETVTRNHLQISSADLSNAQSVVRQGYTDDIFNSLPKNYQDYLINRQADLNAVTDWRNTPAKELQYYNQNKAQFTNYCIRHILVNTQQQAQDIYNQLKNGGDFAALAKANSIDSGSATNGGDLGCMSQADVSTQFIQPFAQAVLAATPGVVTMPVQSQYGWHLIEVTSKSQQSFNDVKSTISQTLSSPSDYFTAALTTAKIKVNPRYGSFVPGDASSGTEPHIAPPTPSGLNTSGGQSSAATDDSQDQSGAVPDDSGSSDGSVPDGTTAPSQ